MKCIDDEIPFEIPHGWEWERWGNISHSIQYGYNAPAETNGDVRMVRISDIQNGDVQWETVPFCHINETDIENYLLQENDILFARTGGTVGKSFLVRKTPYPAIYAGYLIRTRYSCFLSPNYLKFFMESQLYWEQLRNGTIATAQPNCNGKTLSKMIVPIPPHNEQIRITDKLKEVLSQVCRYGLAQDRLDNLNFQIQASLKKSILQEAIQGRLVPQIPEEGTAQELLEQIRQEKARLVKEGKLKKSALMDSIVYKGDDNRYYEQIGTTISDITEEIPFELPKSWMWSRLGIIAELHIGKTPPRGEQRYWSDGTYNWVAISDMVEGGFISKTKEKITEIAVNEIFKREISPSGSLLMSFKLTVGKTSILETEAYHNEAIITISPFRDDNYILRNYLFHILPLISNYGDSKDAIKGKTLNSKSLNDLLIPLPPLAEQARILEKLEVVYHKVSK